MALTVAHSTTVVTADDALYEVGSDEWNANHVISGLTGVTVTADAPILDMSQTWNNAGVTFTGLRWNITDSASNVLSKLLDIQVGGNPAFTIGNTGEIIGGLGAITTLSGDQIGVSLAYNLATHWAQVWTGYGNVNFSHKIWIQKTRGTSPTDFALLSADDAICVLSFLGSNGSAFQEAVSIDVKVDGTPSAGVMPGKIDIVTNEASSGSLVRMTWDSKGNVIMRGKTGGGASITTDATDGFFYLAASSGPPTGIPSAFADRVPLAVDQTNNKLYIYSNSQWRAINP